MTSIRLLAQQKQCIKRARTFLIKISKFQTECATFKRTFKFMKRKLRLIKVVLHPTILSQLSIWPRSATLHFLCPRPSSLNSGRKRLNELNYYRQPIPITRRQVNTWELQGTMTLALELVRKPLKKNWNYLLVLATTPHSTRHRRVHFIIQPGMDSLSRLLFPKIKLERRSLSFLWLPNPDIKDCAKIGAVPMEHKACPICNLLRKLECNLQCWLAKRKSR